MKKIFIFLLLNPFIIRAMENSKKPSDFIKPSHLNNNSNEIFNYTLDLRIAPGKFMEAREPIAKNLKDNQNLETIQALSEVNKYFYKTLRPYHRILTAKKLIETVFDSPYNSELRKSFFNSIDQAINTYILNDKKSDNLLNIFSIMNENHFFFTKNDNHSNVLIKTYFLLYKNANKNTKQDIIKKVHDNTIPLTILVEHKNTPFYFDKILEETKCCSYLNLEHSYNEYFFLPTKGYIPTMSPEDFTTYELLKLTSCSIKTISLDEENDALLYKLTGKTNPENLNSKEFIVFALEDRNGILSARFKLTIEGSTLKTTNQSLIDSDALYPISSVKSEYDNLHKILLREILTYAQENNISFFTFTAKSETDDLFYKDYLKTFSQEGLILHRGGMGSNKYLIKEKKSTKRSKNTTCPIM